MIVNHHQVDFKNRIFEIIIVSILIAIALCTASPLDPPPISQFKQDYLRFWPTGDGKKILFNSFFQMESSILSCKIFKTR